MSTKWKVCFTLSWVLTLLIMLFIGVTWGSTYTRNKVMAKYDPPASFSESAPISQDIHWGRGQGDLSMAMTSKVKLVPAPGDNRGMMPAVPGPGTEYSPGDSVDIAFDTFSRKANLQQVKFMEDMDTVFQGIALEKEMTQAKLPESKEEIWSSSPNTPCTVENGIGVCGRATEADIPKEVRAYILQPIVIYAKSGRDEDIRLLAKGDPANAVNAAFNRWLYITGGCCQEGHMDMSFIK